MFLAPNVSPLPQGSSTPSTAVERKETPRCFTGDSATPTGSPNPSAGCATCRTAHNRSESVHALTQCAAVRSDLQAEYVLKINDAVLSRKTYSNSKSAVLLRRVQWACPVGVSRARLALYSCATQSPSIIYPKECGILGKISKSCGS